MTSMCQRVCSCLTSLCQNDDELYGLKCETALARTTGVVLKQFGSKSVSEGGFNEAKKEEQLLQHSHRSQL